MMDIDNSHLDVLESIPGFTVVVDENYLILYVSNVVARQTGVDKNELVNESYTKLFSKKSQLMLGEYLQGKNFHSGRASETLTLLLNNGSRLEVGVDLFLIEKNEDQESTLLVITSSGKGLFDFAIKAEAKYRSVRNFVDSLDVATWCIQYEEPVDLSQPDSIIIDQIFANSCYWTMCNKAMATLYGLPDDLDFNKQPVSKYFPRTPENELFVQELIDNDFFVDNAISIDRNHDGSSIYIANTVRSQIENNYLMRWWGTVIDVSEEKRSKNKLVKREAEVRNILSSIPDCIIVADKHGCIEAVNPAVYRILSWDIEKLLGKSLRILTDRKEFLTEMCELFVSETKNIHEELTCGDGEVRSFWISASSYLDSHRSKKIVMVIRHEV